MSSTSTNKQPLLIDRPLHVVSRLDQTSQPTGSNDPGTGTNGTLLVDCTGSSDGALIDTLYLIQRVDDDEAVVNLFFSTSNSMLGVTTTGGQANAWFLGCCKFAATQKAGSFVEFDLPFILAPVPHAGSSEETIARDGAVNSKSPARFRALVVPRGMALWAAVCSPTPVAAAPNIACQGGFY